MSRVSAKFGMFFVCLLSVVLLAANVFAQETTGGLQGAVKDPSGAVVSKAHVVLTSPALEGDKNLDTDNGGYYHFANLPPGVYSVTVKAAGFSELKRDGIRIEVGHLPTLDLTLAVGSSGTVVEVTGSAPVIDVTTNTNQTNLTAEDLNDTPHGYSFQSVIQYAPMARNEPLAGGMAGAGPGGNGGALPGSSGNGFSVGFSVGGGADSENTYLVEGQDTENISGGASQANVPFQFIQEVQVKTSGIEAEHGGALGGVVNVVMKKGSNAYHGSFFATYEADALDGSTNGTLRYDPLGVPNGNFDPDSQTYIPKKDHFSIVQPGFTVGGPIIKDRLWFFLGFAPEYNSTRRTVNFGPSNICAELGGCPSQSLGNQVFTSDNQQYFASGRLDFTLTQKIRVFASWLDQYTRETGDNLPSADPINSQAATYLNTSIFTPLTGFSHGFGYSAPNSTYNFGADISLTPKIVSTTRFGYFYNNYHDFGWPTTGSNLDFQIGGQGNTDNLGNPYTGTALEVPNGSTTAPWDQSFTEVNASKHYQFDQDVAFFKSGWGGTHNIKVGYQYNRLWNIINQHANIPLVNIYAIGGVPYTPSSPYAASQCALLETNPWGICAGQYGWAYINDFATVLKTPSGAYAPAIDNNHALFAQDSWTVGHGLTLNLGIRVEKESLPAPAGIGVAGIRAINFSWSDKIEPRLGAAWGSRDGRMKLFGSYGVTNDIMKLLLAQTSFGAQGYENCFYPLGPDSSGGFQISDVTAAPNSSGRACPTGPTNTPANFVGGVTPQVLTDAATGVQLLQNINYRPEEPVSPGVKPYRQHEFVGGWDYQLRKDWALEVRYDRRRLDHVIEDASLEDPDSGTELYSIVNPGQGVDSTFDGYASYLTSIGSAFGPGVSPFNASGDFGTCPTCPHMPVAVRNYDGVEVRLTKTQSKGWSGMFSYTWSSLWGNYTGLTTTDQIDGGTTGRNSPDTTRAFDEPFYYFKYNGQSANGPLPTDRPNTFKGYVYYTMPWKGNSNTTTIGLFQVAYEGSPMSSYTDVGLQYPQYIPLEATYVYGRGNWVNVTTDSAGNITLGNPYARRTPWYTQSDLNLSHSIKVNHNNEAQVLSFNATLTNLLNQHAVTSYWEGFNSNYFGSAFFNGDIYNGAAFYQQVETGYDPQAAAAGMVLNSHYGSPNLWQISRKIRLGVQFTF
ncbi:MAG: TonB-dependent receptor [Candidatus Sulfotelmatobacter sp.]